MKKWLLKEKSMPHGNSATEYLGIDKNIADIMINRGIEKLEDIKMYINPSFDFLRDPFLLKGMDRAVSRIKEAISNKEKICIYGDYDVDGVSSTSILKIYFDSIGYPVQYYIPNRLEEGYGLNEDAVKYVYELGTQLMITVDCGITSIKEVEVANELGMDVIITDHHECQGEVPNAYSVINPKQEACPYPFKGICGCGVAFKLIHGLSGEDFKKDIRKYIEIVSLATICDVMPVLDENRIIVKNGLELIGSGDNIGMRELVKVCGLEDTKIRSSHLGFAIGPRINASGRLGYSNLGVELFTTKDKKEAEKLALAMDMKNEERQLIEARIYQEAEEMLKSNPRFKDDKVLVLAGENWHHGIIGIVASKLTEKYYKPTVLLCIEGDEATGSARSIKGFDMFASLSECKELMEKFGGHEQAAGLTVKVENIDKLRDKINEIADYELEQEDLIEEIKMEYEIDEKIVDLAFVDKLHILEPFGIKNPTPYFLLRDCYVKNAYLIGKDKNHLKLNIEKSRDFECIGFGLSHLMDNFDIGDLVDIVFQIDENTFNGNTKVQLLLKDIRLSRPENILKYPNNMKEIEKLLNIDNIEKAISKYRSSNKEQEEYFYNREINNLNEIDLIDSNKSKIHDKKYNLSERKIGYICKKEKKKETEDKNAVEIARIQYITDLLDDGDLLIVNSMNGYYRAKSDINLLSDKKIDYIFLSNIDKTDFKVYNKLIMYDYFDNCNEIEYILESKRNDSEFLINFNSSDYVYIRNKNRESFFNRDEFVLAYKFFMANKGLSMKYSEFVHNLGLSPIKVHIILKVLSTENLIKYSVDYDNDLFEFELLPKPKNKLNLEENNIVSFFNSKKVIN